MTAQRKKFQKQGEKARMNEVLDQSENSERIVLHCCLLTYINKHIFIYRLYVICMYYVYGELIDVRQT